MFQLDEKIAMKVRFLLNESLFLSLFHVKGLLLYAESSPLTCPLPCF